MSQWCDKCWAPIRDDERYNGVAASMLVMQAFMEDERVMREAGWDPETGVKADASPEVMNAILEKHSPVCCFLGKDKMLEIMTECFEMGKKPKDAN